MKKHQILLWHKYIKQNVEPMTGILLNIHRISGSVLGLQVADSSIKDTGSNLEVVAGLAVAAPHLPCGTHYDQIGTSYWPCVDNPVDQLLILPYRKDAVALPVQICFTLTGLPHTALSSWLLQDTQAPITVSVSINP